MRTNKMKTKFAAGMGFDWVLIDCEHGTIANDILQAMDRGALSQSMGHSGNPKAPAVAKAIDEALAKIVAAGKTPGMPGSAATVQAVMAKGVRYIYTHLPLILGTGAKTCFKAARSAA